MPKPLLADVAPVVYGNSSTAITRLLAASAYSKFRPVNREATEAAYQQNRRIEISVIPKDANVRKLLDEYVQGSAPAPTGAPPAPSPTPASPVPASPPQPAQIPAPARP